MVIDSFISLTNSKDPLISLLEYYRGADIPNQDEILLHSGGPITDLAKRSFLPCLQSIRLLFFEPQKVTEVEISSAMKGQIKLGYSDPLTVIIQKYNDGRWDTIEELEVKTLELAINLTKKWEIPVEDSQDLPIVPGGFTGLLGYDLNRWSVGIKLENTPPCGTLLGDL